MDPINGVNAQNYAVAAPQGQNNQVQDTQDYSSMPMVYEPETEVKKKASSNMLGMTALGVLAVVGIGYGIHNGRKVSGLKQEIAQLSAEKEALGKAKEEALKAKEEAVKAKEDIQVACGEDLSGWWKRIFKRFFNPEANMTQEGKDARKAYKASKEAKIKEAEKTKKDKKAEKADNKKAENKADNKADDVNKEENK